MKILRRIVLALAGLYLTGMVLAIVLNGDPWASFGIGILLIFSLPILAAVIVPLLVLPAQKSCADPQLASFTRRLALIFAAITLALTVAAIILSVGEVPAVVRRNWSGNLQIMLFVFGALTLLPLLVGYPAQWLLARTNARFIRPAAKGLILLCTAAVLLYPTPMGSYNDGGSRIVQAVLYEAIYWKRSDFPNDEGMYVYVFPLNCLDYETKWALFHGKD